MDFFYIFSLKSNFLEDSNFSSFIHSILAIFASLLHLVSRNFRFNSPLKRGCGYVCANIRPQFPLHSRSLFPLIDLFALACAHHSVSAFAISLHISAVTVFIGVSFAFSTLHALLHSFTLYLCLLCAAFCLFSFSQFSLTQFLWPPAN